MNGDINGKKKKKEKKKRRNLAIRYSFKTTVTYYEEKGIP